MAEMRKGTQNLLVQLSTHNTKSDESASKYKVGLLNVGWILGHGRLEGPIQQFENVRPLKIRLIDNFCRSLESRIVLWVLNHIFPP
jgi:hypothetical protein